jgi:ribonuclease HI
MPWRSAVLRGARVLARCDDRGELRVDGGRVEVRYRPKDGKAYQAAPANLVFDSEKEIFPDEHCAEAVAPAPAAADSKAKPAVRGKSAASASPAVAPVSTASIVAYTDGACSGNPGPAGLGVVLTVGDARRELSEYLGTGTNNIAELTAILRALESVGGSAEPVQVYTDSQYAIGVLTKGWKPKVNQELIANTKLRMREFKKLSLIYVKGHAGIPLNERADELARQAVSSRSSPGWREVVQSGRQNA